MCFKIKSPQGWRDGSAVGQLIDRLLLLQKTGVLFPAATLEATTAYWSSPRDLSRFSVHPGFLVWSLGHIPEDIDTMVMLIFLTDFLSSFLPSFLFAFLFLFFFETFLYVALVVLELAL